MAAKVFLFNDPVKGWIYGAFKSDGITPQAEITLPPCRKRWEDVNGVDKVSFYYTTNHGFILQPYLISEIASDLIGTPWASRAVFNAATNDIMSDGLGISDGEYDAVLSNTVDLVSPGWIEATLLGGTIKYTTINGETRTRAVDLGWVSLTRVKRVWLTGTTAGMGIVVHY